MNIIIVDYGMGNYASIQNMIAKIGFNSIISDDISEIAGADKLILPGVGRFDVGMRRLEEKKIIPILEEKIVIDKVPILGICLGMHLLCRESEEGNSNGLKFIEANVMKFNSSLVGSTIKIPHMGWNIATTTQPNPLTNKNDTNRFYFVHSYHVSEISSSSIILESTHGYKFCSGFMKENIYGVQFHPEKSHRFGYSLLKNFILNT
jgi:glutamine amidotransferase